ncbi:MAG: hypothetical protein BHV80_09870 [Phocaeicola vulgatus]|uniref:Uncharacterized protein n=1 Tax=Phocaeicola vulgatus TaxID=821 RepID=A0A1Q6J6J1_PHOVU|nr:MAG: hypothetical protein BHV80_09870 [Phocaeicola vulgatus]
MIPKTLGKNKTSAVYKPKTIFNKNNCLIICDIYRKSLSLSIETFKAGLAASIKNSKQNYENLQNQ